MAQRLQSMDELFKGRHFEREVIVVRSWYVAGVELLHRIRKGQFNSAA